MILPSSSRFQTLTDRSVQFDGASATADPYFLTWIGRQSNQLVRNRHVIDKFVPQDILIHKPSVTHWDVLNNAEGDGTGTAAAQFNLVGPCVLGPASGCRMSHFLDPVDPGGLEPAPAPGPPATAPPDLGPRVTMLEQQVQSLTGEIRSLRDQAAALTATVTATTAATDANTESVVRIDKYLAEHPIAVSCYARLGGVPIGCSLK